MVYRKQSPMFNVAILSILILGAFGCEKSESIVSSEDTLASVTAEVIDMELVHAVKQALAQEQSLAGVDISVTANSGVVSLSGLVENQAQHDQVLKIAGEVVGVQSVSDEININKQSQK